MATRTSRVAVPVAGARGGGAVNRQRAPASGGPQQGKQTRPVIPAGVPGWRRAACLGCDKTVVAARDDFVLIGGTPDGSYLMQLGAELLRIQTTVGATPPDAPMYLLGAAHRRCSPLARLRLERGPDLVTEGLPVLVSDAADHLPPLTYTLHEPVQEDMCPFCDADTEITAEHIWPDWFSRDLIARGAVLSGTGVVNGKIDLTVPVCRTCNNTWMSVMENDTRPLLLRMFDAATGAIEQFSLTPAEQTQLATWAVKTAFLLDALAQPVVPRGYLHEFALRRAPSAATVVWVAGFTPHGPAIAAKRALDFPGPGGTPTTNSPNGFVVTFTILDVLFQVVGQFNDEVARVRDDRAQYAPALFRIWPTQAAVIWPPKFGFSATSWSDLTASIGPSGTG